MGIVHRPALLKYKNYRYLKGTGLLTAIAVVLYVSIKPTGGEPYGGTWLGSALGIVSALIVIVQMWYGIRKHGTPGTPERRHGQTSGCPRNEGGSDESALTKRRKKQRRVLDVMDSLRYGGTLQEWLSAHVHLGTSLIVLATLHAGFQFGWNVHTLSYALMLLVIGSGFYGVFACLNYPRLITQNMGTDTLDGVLLKIAELDELARTRALGLPDEVNMLVLKARQETRIGGSLFQQLRGSQRDCPTALAVKQTQPGGNNPTAGDQAILMRDLHSLLLQKQNLVLQARNEVMLKARMHVWLYLHVPLSVAMLAALFAHILAIYYYW